MYAVTSANAVSSLGTPYALQNGLNGYGECGRKIQAMYGKQAMPNVLAKPQLSTWSPSDPVEPPVQLGDLDIAAQGAGVPTPRADRDPYQLVNEPFAPGRMMDQSCGIYNCGPGMKVYRSYENFNKSTEVAESSRTMLLFLSVATVGAIFYALARASSQ